MRTKVRLPPDAERLPSWAMPPRRALVVVHSYYLKDTRAHRHGAALAQQGWQVDVVCMRDRGEAVREVADGVSVWRLPARRRGGSPQRKIFEYCWFAFLGLMAITALFAVRRHRVIYVLGIPNFIVFSAVVPRLFGARVLLDMRDPFPEFFLAKYDAPERHPFLPVMLFEERLSARFATRVLTVGPSMAELLARSVPPEKISIVRNAPDPSLFAARPPRTDDTDNRTLLYVGTVTLPYGVDLAVRAVARLRSSIPALRIRIVGHGDLFDTIDEIAREADIRDRVIIEGSVPIERIPQIVSEAWLGVQPGRDSPLMRLSLSSKILEWCRLGLPVAVARTPPLEEIFAHDELLFFEPGDLDGLCSRIAEAHADPAALAQRAERAQLAVQKVRFEDQVGAFLQAVDTAQGGGGVPR